VLSDNFTQREGFGNTMGVVFGRGATYAKLCSELMRAGGFRHVNIEIYDFITDT